MTVTIPTGDLIGLISDVAPFAAQDDKSLFNCVRLEWDGNLLHAMATDRYHLAWGQWHPDDEHELPRQDSLFTTFGGDGDPWSAVIGLPDALHIKKVFKLGKKQWATALTVQLTEDGSVEVARDHDTGYSALIATLPGLDRELIDFRAVLSKHDTTKERAGLAFNAKQLADFAKVRARGPMHMIFTETIAHVSIGQRFCGAIMPINETEET